MNDEQKQLLESVCNKVVDAGEVAEAEESQTVQLDLTIAETDALCALLFEVFSNKS